MSRLRFTGRVTFLDVAAVFVALAPVVALVIVGYFQANARVNSDLTFLAQTSSQRATAIFVAARKNLQVLAINTQGKCNEAAIKAMRDIVFRSTYFREAGTVIDNRLTCTDGGMLEPPVMVTDPTHRALAAYGDIAIVPPVQTLRPGKSIITNYKVTDHAYVNLLINPEIFNEFQQYLKVGERNGILILSADGQAIASVGNMEGVEAPPMSILATGDTAAHVVSYHGSRYAVVHSPTYPVTVVASASNAHVIQEWKRNAYVFGPIGLILSGFLLVVVRRMAGRATSMENQLRRAVARNEISVVYQPVVDMRTGQCLGCEALMRWHHPRDGHIPPSVFIPVAEQSDAIFILTEWLMYRIASDLSADFKEFPTLFVDINICAEHFQDRWIVEAARRTLVGRIPFEQVIFELTERGRLSADDPHNLAVIRELHEMGARMSIDDFGVGYSNLSALQKIGFDYLKIDKAFVDGIESEERSSGLVDTVISIGNTSNTEIVAEGVEHLYQAKYLIARGVYKAQGFHFAKPMPLAQFREFLRMHRAPD